MVSPSKNPREHSPNVYVFLARRSRPCRPATAKRVCRKDVVLGLHYASVALGEPSTAYRYATARRLGTRYAMISASGKNTRLMRKYSRKLCPFRAATRAGQK